MAGAARDPFTRSGHRALFQRSQGVPRLINIIADRSLAAGFAREKDRIDASLVNAAADEIQLGEPGVSRRRWPRYAAAAVVLVALAAGLWAVLGPWGERGAATRPATGTTVAEDPPADAPPAVVNEPAPEPEPAVVQPAAPVESVPMEESIAVEPDAPLTDEWFEAQDLRAWSALAGAWGAPEDAALVEASCLGREGLGYACLRDQGTWLRIRQLGLPVVLELPGEPPGHLLLSGMDGDRLLVGAGSAGETVDREAIERRWFGDYLVAWPQAPDWPREIGRGDTGEAVDRVLALAARTGRPYTGGPEFGADFEQWLRDFQLRNGLEPDGIVGPKTLLYLMRFSIEEPRLLTGLDGGS